MLTCNAFFESFQFIFKWSVIDSRSEYSLFIYEAYTVNTLATEHDFVQELKYQNTAISKLPVLVGKVKVRQHFFDLFNVQ